MLHFFLKPWLFHVNSSTCYSQTNRMRHCLMLAAADKLGKQSTAAKIHIWLYGTQASFLRNWLCSLSTSRQMIAMEQLQVLDTSFHPLINCVTAVQNLYATKCHFLSLGRRLVLTWRMVLTFVITVTMVSEWLYYATGFMTLKALNLLFCHLGSQDAFTTVGINLDFAP